MHLRLDELRGCFDASMSLDELRPLIAIRKAAFARHQALKDLPPRFVTRGAVLTALARVRREQEDTAARMAADGDALRGTPCSPGLAEGIAKVVKEANEFDSGILVTYRTDPGWIPVFPSARALLIERGSPLTHAAIVAREIGIPTIVQIPGLTERIKTGMSLRVDGHSGLVTLL
ncbi:MAG: PEP-utilizing enzyme [Burkholderia gladioli]